MSAFGITLDIGSAYVPLAFVTVARVGAVLPTTVAWICTPSIGFSVRPSRTTPRTITVPGAGAAADTDDEVIVATSRPVAIGSDTCAADALSTPAVAFRPCAIGSEATSMSATGSAVGRTDVTFAGGGGAIAAGTGSITGATGAVARATAIVSATDIVVPSDGTATAGVRDNTHVVPPAIKASAAATRNAGRVGHDRAAFCSARVRPSACATIAAAARAVSARDTTSPGASSSAPRMRDVAAV